MEKVICIKIGDYTHHKKLEVGKVYLHIQIPLVNNIFIKNLDNTNLGFFPSEFFCDWITWNRNEQINKII